MKDTIVLYAALGRGHVLSMVDLGKLILTHHPSFSIRILILARPNNNTKSDQQMTCGYDATSQYIAAVSAAIPSITFHHIPPISLTPTLPPHFLTIELSQHSNQSVHHILQSISKTSNLKAIVVDFLNYHATQVTTNLGIPTYFYYTSGASTLAVLLHSPTIHKNTTKPLNDHYMHFRIPGLPKISTDDLTQDTKDPANPIYGVFPDIGSTMMRDSVGIIVNTFDAIEGRAIEALRDGLGFPEGTTPPPLFCIGPVISVPSGEEDMKGCLSWLDSQPSQSVVLLSFGSLGRFSRSQLKELAIGLERSEQRFLWVVRCESDETSLEELLPYGFLERTKNKGFVVMNWAPQAAILSHDSVGGFVTHCGWNSVLEAVCEGVPMVVWPLYAEQKMNRVILVQEMKVALSLNEFKDGFVSATELGDRVKELMDSDTGKEIRQRIFKMKISAAEAREEGGSSYVDLSRVVQLWKQY